MAPGARPAWRGVGRGPGGGLVAVLGLPGLMDLPPTSAWRSVLLALGLMLLTAGLAGCRIRYATAPSMCMALS